MRPQAIYFDIETTGLRPESDRIVEIAAYNSTTHAEFTALVNPKIPIPQDASKIHGISDTMVADAPSFAQIAEEFRQFCAPNGETAAILIGHNCDQFDAPFLRAEFQRADLVPPTWRYLDSLKWARKYRPDLPRHGLQFLRSAYDIAENSAHRALDDVLVLHRVFSQMLDDLDVEEALELLKEDLVQLVAMPFGKHRGVQLESVPKNYLKWLQSSGALEKGENASLKTRLLELRLLI